MPEKGIRYVDFWPKVSFYSVLAFHYMIKWRSLDSDGALRSANRTLYQLGKAEDEPARRRYAARNLSGNARFKSPPD